MDVNKLKLNSDTTEAVMYLARVQGLVGGSGTLGATLWEGSPLVTNIVKIEFFGVEPSRYISLNAECRIQ